MKLRRVEIHKFRSIDNIEVEIDSLARRYAILS